MKLAVLLVLALAACTRPLTPAERTFASDLFGPSLDTTNVRIAQGLGVIPPMRTVPASLTRVSGTEKACVRVPQPRGTQPPQAFALGERIHFTSDIYSSDMALSWPHTLRFPQALILAHELAHVWQWQNRELTGYTPGRAVTESLRIADPYFAQPGLVERFAEFGYEQQAAMVEDFVCFTIANPGHPRRGELRTILAPVLPVDQFEASIAN